MERVGPEAFDGARLRRSGTWIVGFLADWCPFCRSFLPKLEAMGGRNGAGVLLADVTDEASPLWEEFGVEVVPTVVVFRDGAAVFRRDGRLGRGLGPEDVQAILAAVPTA